MSNSRVVDLPNGRSLFLQESGAGPEIVLIHGALATHCDWMGRPFDAFAAFARVVAIDRPGHGRSIRPRFASTPRDQARQIRDGLARVGLQRPLVVGHSMGAMAALAFAELFPAEVAGLLLISPFAFPEPRPTEHWLLAPRATPLFGPWLSEAASWSIDVPLLETVQTLMFDPEPVPPAWKASFPYRDVLEPSNMVAEGEDFAALTPGSPAGLCNYSAIRAPAHVVCGTSDRIIDPGRHARPLSNLLDCAVTEIRGGSHMIHQSHTGEIVDLARELLQLQSAAR